MTVTTLTTTTNDGEDHDDDEKFITMNKNNVYVIYVYDNVMCCFVVRCCR